MAEGRQPKTHHKSGSKFSEFAGGSRELIPSELPTERAFLMAPLQLQRKAVVEKCLDKGQYQVKEIMADLLPVIKSQGLKASSKFSGEDFVSDRQILGRLIQLWKEVTDVAWKRGKVAKNKEIVSFLDRLFDISKCRCPLQSCGEVSCPATSKGGLMWSATVLQR